MFVCKFTVGGELDGKSTTRDYCSTLIDRRLPGEYGKNKIIERGERCILESLLASRSLSCSSLPVEVEAIHGTKVQ